MRRNRSGCLSWIGILALVGALLFLFRFELLFARDFALSILQGHPVETFPALPDSMRLTIFIAENLLAILFFTILVLYWISYSGFPVTNDQQIFLLMRQILRTWMGRAAPLLVVKEGILIGEVGKTIGSTILVDLVSAILVENQSFRTPAKSRTPESSDSPTPLRPSYQRVSGPGLIFLNKGDRLRDVVSLRKQYRVQKNVLGQTSEGIELRTNVFAVFTLGQPADVVQVAYVGDKLAENLRVMQIDPQTRMIRSIEDELDDQDKQEIHVFAKEFIDCIDPNSRLEVGGEIIEAPPYWIDPKRIIAAVYARAKNVSDQQTAIRWADLPAMVAAETFRNMISRYTLDALYLPDDPEYFPLMEEIKPEFTRRVRYLGAMAFQYIERINGETPIFGQVVNAQKFRISAVQDLRGPKVLRDRGIKIIEAGFSELNPTDPQINQQRVENWKARWQKEADLIRASMDLEVMRIRSHARAEKQHEMIETLSNLFKSSAYSEEALGLRIFQALEDIAADPDTRQLLPKDTLSLLKSLRLGFVLDENPRLKLLDNGQPEEGAQ
jgi:hypothetical protein